VLAELAGQNVLLLQGPAGPFFRRVAGHLRGQGCTVTKVNFNFGEDFYYPGPDVVRYRGTLEAWPDVFAELVRARSIRAVLMFGDLRPLHAAAIKRAETLGVRVLVFEEGYLRPDYVTLEENGVNGYTSLPRDVAFYRDLQPGELPAARPVNGAFAKSMVHTICYATVTAMFKRRYPHYRHHRDIRPFHQMALWLRGGARRLVHTVRDYELDRRLKAGDLPPYFFVPLQVHLDSQMRHCHFDRMEDFIRYVVGSFAAHAPASTLLLLKLHPMDRAYRDYGPLLSELAAQHGLGDRLIYADVIDTYVAVRGALGAVMINSTVGISAMAYGVPVKCLGAAVYDLPGLTHQGSLDDFWRNPGTVDAELFERFRWWVRTKTQLNGSVWSDIYELGRSP
jgi:capsule polysaccharide modification protein KpsS